MSNFTPEMLEELNAVYTALSQVEWRARQEQEMVQMPATFGWNSGETSTDAHHLRETLQEARTEKSWSTLVELLFEARRTADRAHQHVEDLHPRVQQERDRIYQELRRTQHAVELLYRALLEDRAEEDVDGWDEEEDVNLPEED